MADTLIESIQDYIRSYTGLPAGRPVWVDYLGANPSQYAIIPLPGARKIEEYLNGGSLREFPFALQATVSTADDYERLATTGFFENFAEWLDTQTKAEIYPTLSADKHPYEILATGWGSLLEQGESDTGVYQIQCVLRYEQEP